MRQKRQCNTRTYSVYLLIIFFFNKDSIYLFMRDTEREAETQAEGEAGSTQGFQDHALGQRQAPNHQATQGSPYYTFFKVPDSVV